MRRRTTNEVVAGIGLLLATSAALFAWFAGRQGSAPTIKSADENNVSTKVSDRLADAAVAERDWDWKETGSRVYDAECAFCHGQGEQKRRTPPLVAHVTELYATPGGHSHLIDFLLFGLEGQIEVGGESYRARHPAYADRLSYEESAAVLNHLLMSWGNEGLLPANTDLYRPQDVLRHRHYQFTPAEVLRWRERIGEPAR